MSATQGSRVAADAPSCERARLLYQSGKHSRQVLTFCLCTTTTCWTRSHIFIPVLLLCSRSHRSPPFSLTAPLCPTRSLASPAGPGRRPLTPLSSSDGANGTSRFPWKDSARNTMPGSSSNLTVRISSLGPYLNYSPRSFSSCSRTGVPQMRYGGPRSRSLRFLPLRPFRLG